MSKNKLVTEKTLEEAKKSLHQYVDQKVEPEKIKQMCGLENRVLLLEAREFFRNNDIDFESYETTGSKFTLLLDGDEIVVDYDRQFSTRCEVYTVSYRGKETKGGIADLVGRYLDHLCSNWIVEQEQRNQLSFSDFD